MARNFKKRNLRETYLESISGLMSCNKIQEKLISVVIISDVKNKIDSTQYVNQHGLSTQHYLINMTRRYDFRLVLPFKEISL